MIPNLNSLASPYPSLASQKRPPPPSHLAKHPKKTPKTKLKTPDSKMVNLMQSFIVKKKSIVEEPTSSTARFADFYCADNVYFEKFPHTKIDRENLFEVADNCKADHKILSKIHPIKFAIPEAYLPLKVLNYDESNLFKENDFKIKYFKFHDDYYRPCYFGSTNTKPHTKANPRNPFAKNNEFDYD